MTNIAAFKDMATLITGASRGLGKALAIQLASQGARVVLVARNPSTLHAVVEQIRATSGTAFAISADVSDKHAIHAIAGGAAALVGPIDLLVNNASTLGPTPMPLLLDTECEDLEAVLRTNLLGPFRLSKIIAGSMALRGRGLVVNISSDAAVSAYPGWGAYSVSKAALDHLTRIFAAELAEASVGFLSIDPGEMDTVMHAEAIPNADRTQLTRPEDVAAAILRLLRQKQSVASGERIILANSQVSP